MSKNSLFVRRRREVACGDADLQPDKHVLRHRIQERGAGAPGVERDTADHSAVGVQPGVGESPDDLHGGRGHGEVGGEVEAEGVEPAGRLEDHLEDGLQTVAPAALGHPPRRGEESEQAVDVGCSVHDQQIKAG